MLSFPETVRWSICAYNTPALAETEPQTPAVPASIYVRQAVQPVVFTPGGGTFDTDIIISMSEPTVAISPDCASTSMLTCAHRLSHSVIFDSVHPHS